MGKNFEIKESTKIEASERLKKIEGQIRGLERMVEQNRYCIDMLMQISSVQEALRGVSKVIMRHYLENCATKSILKGDPSSAEETYKEIMDVIFKYAR
ncbi:MAG: metal-sensitive transcriptional regulator [Fidelibacterota bacterium]|jgi:DNA-binding FrmR family transcriptional regulator